MGEKKKKSKLQTEITISALPSTVISKSQNTDLTDSTEVVVGLFDGLLTDVRPEYQALREEKVHCGRILKIADDHSRLRPARLRVHQTNIPPVGEEQQRRTWRRKFRCDQRDGQGFISLKIMEQQTRTFSLQIMTLHFCYQGICPFKKKKNKTCSVIHSVCLLQFKLPVSK